MDFFFLMNVIIITFIVKNSHTQVEMLKNEYI